MRRGLVALALGVAWFAWGGPAAVAALDTVRSAGSRHRTTRDLLAAAATADVPPATRTELATLERDAAREAAWGFVVAGLLTPAERAEGLARAADLPALIPATDHNFLEPEMPALVEAIERRYGVAVAPVPTAPLQDAWSTVDRRTRARALTALVEGPGLGAERAAIVLGATLDLLDTQRERSDLEATLDRALPR